MAKAGGSEVEQCRVGLGVLAAQLGDELAIDDEQLAVRHSHGITSTALVVKDAEHAEEAAGSAELVRDLTSVESREAVLDLPAGNDKAVPREVVLVMNQVAAPVAATPHRGR